MLATANRCKPQTNLFCESKFSLPIVLSSTHRSFPVAPQVLAGILFGVLFGSLFELLGLVSQLLGHRLFEGMISLGRLHHAVDHREAVFGVECRPPCSHHVRTHIPGIELDRGMVNLGHEFEGGRLEGVLRGKGNAEDEFPSGIGR